MPVWHIDNPGPRKIFDRSSAQNPDGEERRETPECQKGTADLTMVAQRPDKAGGKKYEGNVETSIFERPPKRPKAIG